MRGPPPTKVGHLVAFLSPRTDTLWFCRGAGKCTAFFPRKDHCSECVQGREDQTLADIEAQLQRGDA